MDSETGQCVDLGSFFMSQVMARGHEVESETGHRTVFFHDALTWCLTWCLTSTETV